ncbi:NAD(P)H-dependent oxidoreductase [Pelotomaculum propionicicum]|uniref:NAD(P)H-dependent oxidoreductase n=1 Tax=Pelotomaculum propionicicum TaxID=258475 RepID=UPI003B7DF1B4
MKVLIVYTHPNPMSFNHAILETVRGELAKKNAHVKVKDLYAMKWNPILSGSDFEQMQAGKTLQDTAQEQADVTWADTLVFIYPIWWFSHPAVLKGWIDRVFSFGYAYHMTENGPSGLLANKRAVVITTSGADEKKAGQDGLLDAIETTMIKGILGFVGITDARHKNFFAVPYVDDEARRKMLEDVKEYIAEI